jgi:hypothetical protein
MITFTVTANRQKAENYLRKISRGDIFRQLDSIAQRGVNALALATPVESGLAASSWGYTVENTPTLCTITWTNRDVESGFPVAIMLQYGYATGTGGYVQGKDYINPAMKPIFDQLADKVWKAVTSV